MAAGRRWADFSSQRTSVSSLRGFSLRISKGPLRGVFRSSDGSAIAFREEILDDWSTSILAKFPSYIGHLRV